MQNTNFTRHPFFHPETKKACKSLEFFHKLVVFTNWPRSSSSKRRFLVPLAFGPFSAVIEVTNMTGATVSNEMEAESKLDKITKQVDGIMLASSATRILVA